MGGWGRVVPNYYKSLFYGMFGPFLPKMSGKFTGKSQIYELDGEGFTSLDQFSQIFQIFLMTVPQPLSPWIAFTGTTPS